jgi:6-hydroxy-3-succinoylpyridine 3-monooxygenase
MIREHTQVVVGLVIPTRDHQRRPNAELDKLSHWTRKHITEAELMASQLPRVIQGGRSPVSKPDTWYPNQPIFQQILLLGDTVLKKRNKVYNWLGDPNQHLDNLIPLDMIETEDGANRVLMYIQNYIADQAKGDGL